MTAEKAPSHYPSTDDASLTILDASIPVMAAHERPEVLRARDLPGPR